MSGILNKRGLLFLIPLLSSCGGGTQLAGGVGTGGTGVVTGTVTGFGSLVMDGIAYNSATPRYDAESTTQPSVSVTAMKVPLGGQLNIQTDAQGNPTSVWINPALVGVVTSVNPTSGTLVVNGMEVVVNSTTSSLPNTFFIGYAGMGAIQLNDMVQVHGVPGTSSSGIPFVQATLIKLMPSNLSITRVSGALTQWNPSQHTFTVNGIPFSFNASTQFFSPFSNQTLGTGALKNGQWVNIWSQTPSGTTPLVAGSVQVSTLLPGMNGNITLSGLVSAVQGNQFQVDGVLVNGIHQGGVTAGQYVTLKGVIDSTTGEVSVQTLNPYIQTPATLSGTISEFVSTGNFVIRGTPIITNSGTVLTFANGASAPLSALQKNGYIAVQGTLQGNMVLASSITVYPGPPANEVVDYLGKVSQYNPSQGTFTLTLLSGSSQQVTLSTSASFGNGTVANLVNGALVEVEATALSPQTLSAYGVSFWNITNPNLSSGTLEISGVLYNYSAGGSSFNLNGLPLTLGSGVSLPSGFGNGDNIDVLMTPSGSQYQVDAVARDDSN
ncbi:DUF5666 domain-containing protein [Ferrovum myxofaciens]|uniref:DUF5666 domain-containing protein n=1 Tax=Ferrovum myxofaciens TaxID=416213 RepID=UPI0023529DE9|nr:DUF5666 domain-containing protein [Ferrovum myxofaciens]MBU6993728.1 hypothetical protein [Ferrovum myxofaciens]